MALLLVGIHGTASDSTEVTEQVPAEPKCTEVERLQWIDNWTFGTDYLTACEKALGGGKKTTEQLFSIYGTSISRECLGCLGDATECGRKGCWRQCLRDRTSELCQTCVNTKCLPNLLLCTGAAGTQELPIPPHILLAQTSPFANGYTTTSMPENESFTITGGLYLWMFGIILALLLSFFAARGSA